MESMEEFKKIIIMEKEDQLKLDNQICFPLYSVSRLITKAYKPFLEKMGITYPQYLVLMVLWEHGNLSVNQIGEKLLLNTNTLSPLIKRMEKIDLLNRTRSTKDERSVRVELTEKG
jgi:DNA-binding MarR family transcriptional regulator